MVYSEPPPTREEVESRWQAVASGVASRESVHAWAEPLMLAEYAAQPDPLVMTALQYLHGFDMTWRSEDQRMVGHGPPGSYVKTAKQIKAELVLWLENCRKYDADPVGWMNSRRTAFRD
jgi:hypothetical protein